MTNPAERLSNCQERLPLFTGESSLPNRIVPEKRARSTECLPYRAALFLLQPLERAVDAGNAPILVNRAEPALGRCGVLE